MWLIDPLIVIFHGPSARDERIKDNYTKVSNDLSYADAAYGAYLELKKFRDKCLKELANVDFDKKEEIIKLLSIVDGDVGTELSSLKSTLDSKKSYLKGIYPKDNNNNWPTISPSGNIQV